MDRQERARQAVVQGRAEKLKALFERAGGNAMELSLIEKVRASLRARVPRNESVRVLLAPVAGNVWLLLLPCC